MGTINDRTGETKTMNCGLCATIIKYRNAIDMDVQFENGEVVKGAKYQHFKSGGIRCPMVVEICGNYANVTNVNVKPPFTFIVDVEYLPSVMESFWSNHQGYAYARIPGGKLRRLHQLVMNAPENSEIDHINGNRADNRKSNLRFCNRSQNRMNVRGHGNNTSGYKGVSWNRWSGAWLAYISYDGKREYLGYHETPEEAARAYNEAAIKHHGEFAKLNAI